MKITAAEFELFVRMHKVRFGKEPECVRLTQGIGFGNGILVDDRKWRYTVKEWHGQGYTKMWVEDKVWYVTSVEDEDTTEIRMVVNRERLQQLRNAFEGVEWNG